MRTSSRATRGGRANKVTKPPTKGRQGGRISQEAALDQLSLAAQASAQEEELNQQHHHNPFHAQTAESPELDETPHDDAAHQLHHHHHANPDDTQHVGQLAAAAAAHSVYVPNGPGAGADPSIHPALQGYGHMDVPLMGSLGDPTPHQEAMETQMQETAAAAAAVSEVRTAEQLVRDSGYDKVDLEQAASALSKRLMSQPGQRLAKQRRTEQQLNLVRRSNVEALLAHVSGQLAASACKNCHKGHGPWTECVVVDGQMCGSCANCWYNASGARCSFHETNNPQPHMPAAFNNPNDMANVITSLWPALAPARNRGMGQAPRVTMDSDGDANDVFQQSWNNLPNLGSREAQLRLKVTIATQQLAIAWAEYNDYQQSQARATRSSAQGAVAAMTAPDATMEEAHGEDVGT